MTIQVVILAAGMGTRLARPHPKPLTKLVDGRTIMQQQVDNLSQTFGQDLRLTIVVGYKMEQIMEHVPSASFVYNENYDQTNTSKSLLKALRNSGPGGILWMNGDVVFDPKLLMHLKPLILRDLSFVSVNESLVSVEEVKYTLNDSNNIESLSKLIPAADAIGEAIGINYVSSKDKQRLIENLKNIAEQDYFETAIQLGIRESNQQWVAASIGELYAVEIDFPADLLHANRQIQAKIDGNIKDNT